MTRALEKMPTPEGIGAGQTATCRLPIGYTYDALMIRMADGVGDIAESAWGSNIDEIRVMVNGDAKIQIDAADLVSLNKWKGHTHADGVLPIFFGQPFMRTILGEDETAYKTAGGVTAFTLEIDLAAGITIGELNVYAWQSSPTYPAGHPMAGQPKVWGSHYRLQKYAKTISATGEHEIADLLKGTYSMAAVHLKSSAISTAEVFANQSRFYNSDAQVRAHMAEVAGRSQQAGFTHLDFIPTNRISDAMPMAVQDFRIKANFTGTGAVPLYVESVQGAGMVAG